MKDNTRRKDAVFFIDPPYTAAGKKAGSRLYTTVIQRGIRTLRLWLHSSSVVTELHRHMKFAVTLFR